MRKPKAQDHKAVAAPCRSGDADEQDADGAALSLNSTV